MSRLGFFLLGAVVGVLFVVAAALWFAFHLADWLVLDGKARRADAVVVLGGGDGSRFRTGLEFYEEGLVDALVLVDIKVSSWGRILALWCPECKTGGKPTTILTGSTSTLVDAQLVHAHCVEKAIKRILVVTDPYHSRRASILFNRQFAGSGIDVVTVSSGNYQNRVPPTETWWHDEATVRMVIAETSKIIGFFLSPLSDLGQETDYPGFHLW